MQKITPFLWFDNHAEAAVRFYTSIFKKSKIGRIARYDKAGEKVSGRAAGSVMTVEFQIEGQDFIARQMSTVEDVHQMHMGVDEAGDHKLAAGIDHASAARN